MDLKLVREAVLGALVCLACGKSATTFETADAGPTGDTSGMDGGAPSAGTDSAGSTAGTSGRSGTSSTAGTAGRAPAAGGSAGAPDDAGGAPPGAGGETSSSGAGGTGGSAGNGAAAAGGIAIVDGPIEIARVLCDKLFGCCTDTELAELPQNLGESEGSCQLGAAIYLTLLVQASEDSIAAMRIQYDGVALSECLARYASEGCDVLRTLDLSSCPEVFAPQVELGGACGISAECIDGYCDGSNNAANPVGQCAEKKQDGAGCAANDECESGLCEPLGAGCVAASAAPICGG